MTWKDGILILLFGQSVFKLKSDILHIGRMILLLLRTTAGLQILLEKPVSRSWQSHQDGGFK